MSLRQAKLYDDTEVKIEHILISLINDYNNNAIKILLNLGVDVDKLHKKIEQSLFKQRKKIKKPINEIPLPLNFLTEKILDNAQKECDLLNGEFIDTQHILLSTLKSDNMVNSVLKEMKIDYNQYLTSTKKLNVENSIDSFGEDDEQIFNKKETKKFKSQGTPILDNFSTDLTKRAAEGKIDPVIGRDEVIQRVAQILSRKKKNNPILIGQPGVGKTTIAEGLALMIVEGTAPRTLLGKRIMSLDLTSIVAGTKYRGQFEERIKGIVDELTEVNDVILFIDEIHTLVGAGNSPGSMDAANVFKPALARGDLQVIGATTLDEFREKIEKDGALTRRFQQVIIDPPSVDETIKILKQIKGSYENFHKVSYSDETIEQCVKLADRYITDREFPDKAIDILDEAGSRTQIKLRTPENIAILETKMNEIKDKKLDVVKNQEYEKAAKLKNEETKILDKLTKEKEKWMTSLNDKKQIVTVEDISEVVSIMTGIPLNRISGEQGRKMMDMEKELANSIIGQEEALIKIAKAIRRNRVGIKNPKKPIGTFMFLGPTGVGKSFFTKKLAEYMFGDEDSLIRFDMSEFQEKHSVSRLIGAPPGYVGYEEGGQLTEKVRRKPYSIILFDEIEKANKEIYNTLLQLLDEGHLTDSLGRKVNFKNCMVIMTSNVGVKKLNEFGTGVGFNTKSRSESENTIKETLLVDELKKQFPPEFLNRLDDVIIFKSLKKEEINKIVDLEINKVKKRVIEMGYSLEVNKIAREYIADQGYHEEYGARPLNRAIQKFIEDPVSEEILSGNVNLGQTIKVSYSKNKDKIIIKVI